MIKVDAIPACLPTQFLKLRHDQTLHDRAIRRNSPPIKVSLAEEENVNIMVASQATCRLEKAHGIATDSGALLTGIGNDVGQRNTCSAIHL
jgi:hypothetical protein